MLITPLTFCDRLSQKYSARIFLKREDLQTTRSYKVRGAVNAITNLKGGTGVCCVSAGNHAQGIAFACSKFRIKGLIYMPENTPAQKVESVRIFGGRWIKIRLAGRSFDESYRLLQRDKEGAKMEFIHPFDNQLVIAGQGTLGPEILRQLPEPVDYLFIPVGGGGLITGLGSSFRKLSPRTKLVGVEPEGCPSMKAALAAGKRVYLPEIDNFVDGAAVRQVGRHAFNFAREHLNSMLVVNEGLVCRELLNLYQREGIVTEPAGALSVAGLHDFHMALKGKTVVCILSGGNNDVSRYPEIQEKSLVYQGLKHYFIIEFTQKPGALREYLDKVLDAHNDITLFEYIKKNNRESGPALVGIQLTESKYLNPLLARMSHLGVKYQTLDRSNPLARFIL